MTAPVVLMILDGWGYSKNNEYNAIFHAKTPSWDKIIKEYPKSLIECGGESVGLPDGQMGNSEVGHITIGAGRTIYQDLTKINRSIADETFFANPILKNAIEAAKSTNKKIHLLGLVSDGGVHSHQDHLFALLNMCKKYDFSDVAIHAFLDGRDVAPKSASIGLNRLQETISKLNVGRLASISGRYYAMDRDKRYDRTKLVYDLLTQQKSDYKYVSYNEALEAAYNRGETDEFVKPTLIECKENSIIEDGDVVLFFNFRADRARQLSYALTKPDFSEFVRYAFPKLSKYITFTNYADNIKAEIAFPKDDVKNSLGEVMQNNNLKQLRIAETEKYAHVTYFFNGGKDKQFKNEDRVLIPSPKVATYDLKPEMSSKELTDNLVAAISDKKYNFIVCNYANADMVGHTGNFDAAVKAIEALDECINRVELALQKVNGHLFITADHGNAEIMFDSKSSQPHTAHSKNLVPFIYVGNKKTKILQQKASLIDIAPTVLNLMQLDKPAEIVGNSIFHFDNFSN